MDFHTKSYKSPDPEVPIQSFYLCINRVTQTLSLGLLWSVRLLDQSQHAKSVSHIIIKLIFHSQKPTLSGSRRVARIFRGEGGGGAFGQ